MTVDDDVRTRLLAARERLAPAAVRIVEVIEQDAGAAAHLTVGELAERAAVSTSAVVRLAKRLGYDGYPQLRLALAAVPGAAESGGERVFAADIAADDPLGTVVGKLAAFETEGILATAALVEESTLRTIVEAMTTARRVVSFGLGASGLVALDLDQKLARIGRWSQAGTSEDWALAQTALLDERDVAIAFSHSGETAAVVEAIGNATRRGALTVGVTAGAGSKLARVATWTIPVAGREDGFRSAAMVSRLSQLLVVDALYVGMLQRLPEAMPALRRTHDAVAPRRSPARRGPVVTDG